ncbi:uncharacterized protein LOC118438048 [Folsomia candida]|uniref:uncharacterized protein LOC118438048 n=1 Tax=Folsomia candida TaxID=158441 RepID=UPI0016055AA2|nr:uncharacterized protein LOC118438048 [Folsomia candida]
MESKLVPEEQLTAGKGNCDKSKGGVDSMDRHCATCAILIPSDQVKKCGKCGRRAYCSRECQKIDWKIKNGDDGKPPKSQGHINWCGLSYGEEDLDWVLREKFDPEPALVWASSQNDSSPRQLASWWTIFKDESLPPPVTLSRTLSLSKS